MFPYQNPELTPEERTHDLLSRMTIEEKIGQTVKLDGFRCYRKEYDGYLFSEKFLDFTRQWIPGTMSVLLRADWWTGIGWNNGIPPGRMRKVVIMFQKYVYETSRLHIPLYIMEEASHGLMALGATVFPAGIGMGAMWDDKLMEEIGRVVGEEASSAGVQATHGPVLDVIRDIRWSRTEENYAEDPELTALYAIAYTKGLQAAGVVPTLKHFCGHGSPEGGHNHGPAHAGPVEMFNCQLRPFRVAVTAGARSVMSSYNAVDGEPVTGSHYYLTEVLRNQMGFNGFVVSDRGAIPRLLYQRVCRDPAECTARALKAGCDVDNGGWEDHAQSMQEALNRKLISVDDLDIAVGHILKLKFELGLFENPFPGGNPVEVLNSTGHKDTAQEASRKCLTLLKNDGLLPLKNIRRLAVIGPNADTPMNQIGDYSAPQLTGDVITVYSGIATMAKARGIEVTYTRGCSVRGMDKSGFAEALRLAAESDAIIFVPGGSSTKYGTAIRHTTTGAAFPEILSPEKSEKESGEGTDRSTLSFSGVQLELFHALSSQGKPIAAIPILGRPLIITELLDKANAVLLAWYPGAFGGKAVAEAVFGEYNPAGRLPVSLPLAEGQLPLYYNSLEDRPDYVDQSSAPLLPFGFGLSYTSFDYNDLQWNGNELSVQVSNTGTFAGEEVVQFYLTALNAPLQRPRLELIGFQRIFFSAGEKRKIICHPRKEALGYFDRNGKWHPPSGDFKFHAGPDSSRLITIAVTLEMDLADSGENTAQEKSQDKKYQSSQSDVVSKIKDR